jgi:hypothetical protein
VEGIDGGEKTPASQSMGHQLGQSGWGGNTRRRGARGVVDLAEERLVWAVYGGLRRGGGAAVRGWRGCRGWSWKGRRGAPARGGAREGSGRAEGGWRRRCSVDWGAAASIDMAQGEAKVGHERRKRTKRGSSSAGNSPYSRTRQWLRRRKWWGARRWPRCCGHAQGYGSHCLKRSAWSGHGWSAVRTGG